MRDELFKFPSTPHLSILGDVDVRDDKVLSVEDRDEFLSHEVIVEEKVDGANLGISFDIQGNLLAQNRGAFLSLDGSGQWKKLGEWLSPRIDALFDQLADRYILFGEWCYAVHSVFYDRLPDWFLCFDLYDKTQRQFLACPLRDPVFEKAGIYRVPRIAKGHFTLRELAELTTESMFRHGSAEGVYLRIDQGDYLLKRAKLVRPSFIQKINEHWSLKDIQPNRLRLESFT